MRRSAAAPIIGAAPQDPTERTRMSDMADTPVLDTLTAMTAESIARSGLDANQLMAARLAALVAVDAPVSSYLMHLGPAVDAGVTGEQVQNTLVAIAPIVGTPRVASAAAKITEALGIVVIALEVEAEAAAEAEDQAQ
jgi:alkylhydroperoxidase/carboxymuconolactone decarboxylase family protein YurZ